MATGTPTFVRIEFFNLTNGSIGQWSKGHGGLNLMNPAKYVAALAENDKVARAVDFYTGEVIASNEDLFDLSDYDMTVMDQAGRDPESDDDPDPDLSMMEPHQMDADQLRAALMAEGDFTDEDVQSYGQGFMIKALMALRSPDPEPVSVAQEEDEDEDDMFDDLAEFDDDPDDEVAVAEAVEEEEVHVITALPDTETTRAQAKVRIQRDDACMCGEPESIHDSVDPPHMFTPQGRGAQEIIEAGHEKGLTPAVTDWLGDMADKVDEMFIRGDDSDYTEAELQEIVEWVTEDSVPTAEEAGQALFIGMPGTKDYIFDGHAGAGPSGAERWMACTASLGASRSFLETLTANQQVEFAKSSTAARQGTTAHAIGESEARLLMGEITEEEHNNTVIELSVSPPDGEEYDDEMAEYLTEYNDLVKQFVQAGHEVHVEMRVTAAVELMTVTDGEPDVHEVPGSADFVALPLTRTKRRKERVLTVGDLKYGKGYEVEADENPQAKIYALGVIDMLAEQGEDVFDIDRVDIIIIQPRLGGIKTWSTTVDDLLEWRDEVLSPALTEALGGLKGGAQFVPGPVQCQWCPARGGCAALAEERMDAAVDLFDTMIEAEIEGDLFPETATLTNDRLAVLYAQATGLTKIADDLKAELQRRLHRGIPVPGYQLVNYTPRSSWKPEAEEKLDPETFDEDVIPEEVIEQLWQRKMLSPTQALKVLGKGNEAAAKYLEGLIDRPAKRPVVAPEGDKRKPWTGVPPEAMFTAVEPEAIAAPAGMFEVEP